jgi:2-(3-amino-3-carboxypropyl)histidine synthase
MSSEVVVRNIASAPQDVVRVKPLKKKSSIPDEILFNDSLNQAIATLPANYNFEIHKTVWKIQTAMQKGEHGIVALQFPEGLLMYACIISDIIHTFTSCRTIIMGDVTYGACCVDDFTAAKLGASYMVHYGHSCLVPITVTTIPTLYVFIEIKFETSHLCQVIRENFHRDDKLAVMGTIQFTSMAMEVIETLRADYPGIASSQAKPLSAGETLGCTSPLLPSDTTALIFVADGRFHLESVMIQNPCIPAYRYDPYGKHMTRESYDVASMKSVRLSAINAAKKCTVFGLILGTLGRQGSPGIFDRLEKILEEHGKTGTVL